MRAAFNCLNGAGIVDAAPEISPRASSPACRIYFSCLEITEALGTEPAGLRPVAGTIWGLALDADQVGNLVPYHRVVSTS